MNPSAEEFLKLQDGSKICYQTFGSPDATPILLISGGGQSMLSWHEDFIAKIATTGSTPYYFIRYDIRDTGRSTHFALLPEDQRSYTLNHLCNDALALLDHLKVQSANFVGFSLGGGIAWSIAANHPERARSLTLISTSPVGPGPGPQDNIPGLDPELLKRIGAAPTPTDWHDREQVVKFLTYFEAQMASGQLSTEEQLEGVERAGLAFDRAEKGGGAVNSFFNQHGAAWTRWPREDLRRVKCPTVVIHGRKDNNVPVRHGEVLSEEIEGAKLVVVDGMGHDLPRKTWDVVVENIVGVVVSS